MHPDIRVRRVYDDPVPEDGTRVLVDRVLAARPAQGRCPPGRLGQGRRTVPRAAHRGTVTIRRNSASSAAATPPSSPSPGRRPPSAGCAPWRPKGL